MIFNSLWPLVFLAAVPIIIILYLLKPKGKDERISSNLLWERLFRNTQSKTFFEKFVHNILMYLQILIAILLILALMAPFIQVKGKSGGNVILLLDTSGSMQMDNGSGESRLEEAVQAACDYVDGSDNTVFTVVTCDSTASLLLANTQDKGKVKQALKEIQCTDLAGDLSEANSLIQTLYESNKDGEKAKLLVFTDGNGAETASAYAEQFEAEISVSGTAVPNLSLDYVSARQNDADYDVAVRITNYSDYTASVDVSLYDGADTLLGVKQLRVEAGGSAMGLFQELSWEGQTLKAELSGISFLDEQGQVVTGTQDGLEQDNVSYAVKDSGMEAAALLVGNGNTYIERAYLAVVGQDIAKAEDDEVLSEESYNIAIYDAGFSEGTGLISEEGQAGINTLFIKGEAYKAGTLQNVMLTVPEGDLTSGLSDFQIGVNEVYYYDVPEWATGFLSYDEKCVGYYGEENGRKTVVLGFDLRESDFPLCAEFPVFMANALQYLSDTSILGQTVYTAGETVVVNPSSRYDMTDFTLDTSRAGLYTVSVEDETEYYVVRFPSGESEGRIVSEGVKQNEVYRQMKVRKSLRNFLLVAILLLLLIEWLIYIHQMKYKGRFYLLIRLLVAVFVVLALLGISIPTKSRDATTIFLVDLSESNSENVSAMSSYLKDTLQDMPKNNQYGIITFGKDSCVEQFLTETNSFTEFMTEPEKNATNFEEAMSRALAMLPSDGAGRIVILTDGRQTKGNLNNLAVALSSGEVELRAVLMEDSEEQDVYLDQVTIPNYLHLGDEYSMTVSVTSNYETDAEIRLYSGSSSVMAKTVHLNKGSNQFVFKQTVTDTDMESYRVVVEAPGDSCEENNEYSVYSMVEASPRILLVSGMDEDSGNFKAVLTAAGADYNVVSAINAPETLSEMLKYKAIILENVYLDDLPEGFTDNVESYVRDYGCGLICCGGEDSFALGGYRDSVLEDILPVDMQLQGVNETPSMAMVMVIDHSGSMLDEAGDGSGVTNLDLAIQAACGAVDNLRDTDYVGVLTFDDGYTWQVPITEASDRSSIKEKIQTIEVGGGTTIKPALVEACKRLEECDVSIKHIVLLTDGMGETTDFEDVAEEINEAGITLSTVAVGQDSDTRLLEKLAKKCNGRYYYSDISSDIPKIFAQEVFLSGDTYIQNGDFALSVAGSNQLVTGLFQEGWPNLYGYIAATAKQDATMVIASEKNDPILTVWQYGLGKTVAWNTDVTNEWTGGYSGQEDYVQLWKRILDYSAASSSLGEDTVDVVNEAGNTVLYYSTDNFSDTTSVSAFCQGPDGTENEITLTCTAPGEYEAVLDAEKTGIYNINVRRSDDGAVSNSVNTATAVQFSDEYRFDVDQKAFTAFINQYGAFLTDQDRVWTKMKQSTEKNYDLTELLLILATLLFLYDVAIRRFCYVPVKGKLRSRIAARRNQREETIASGRISNPGAEEDQGRQEVREMPTEAGTEATKEASGKASEPVKEKRTEFTGEKKQEPQKQKKKEKKKAGSQEPQMLDTSALLKKKDDRNLH